MTIANFPESVTMKVKIAMLRRVRLCHSMASVCQSVRPSVRLSICPSVTFRYRDHVAYFENNFAAD